MLYASFSIVFTIPKAALQRPGIPGGAQFAGQSVGAYTLSWAPQLAWFLAIGAGLAFAWASSDVWHLVSSKKLTPKKMEVTIKRIPSVTNPPPPPALAPSAPEPVIEEVFVIGSNSLLVKHMSRSLMSDKDRDVVGSMISAISSFVREAFTERDGEVHEVTLGDHRFVMCSDRGIVLAVLVSSGNTEDIVHRLRHLLAILDDRYGARLATSQAETAPIRHVDLPFLKEVDDLRKEGFENRILLDSPEGYIPGRNLIFYGLAGYYAELDAARYLVGGHNGVDPESFPDSSPKFFNFLNSMFHLSLWSYDKAPVQILVPLSGKSKEEVVRMGLEMNVPFDVTWSCYWDRAVHCGTCISCRERRDAFANVGIEDPVEYET